MSSADNNRSISRDAGQASAPSNCSPAAYILHLDLSKEELPVCAKHAMETQMVADAIGAPFRFTSAPEGLVCVHCNQENADVSDPRRA